MFDAQFVPPKVGIPFVRGDVVWRPLSIQLDFWMPFQHRINLFGAGPRRFRHYRFQKSTPKVQYLRRERICFFFPVANEELYANLLEMAKNGFLELCFGML